MSDDDFNQTMQLAIQAQKEIRQQLIAEIASLESSTQQRYGLKSVMFYSQTLSHVVEENNSIKKQINYFKTVVLPDLRQQKERIMQKRKSIESKIETLGKSLDLTILSNLSNKNTMSKTINDLIMKYQKEIEEITLEESSLTQNNNKLRKELREIQNQALKSQRESAKQSWNEEMADEKVLNNSLNSRKRARTIRDIKQQNRIPQKQHRQSLAIRNKATLDSLFSMEDKKRKQ